MSAARAAARAKPVIVDQGGAPRAGRQGRRDPHRRARGIGRGLRRRVSPCRPAARVRSRRIVRRHRNARRACKPFPGQRLAILTNGGGVGVLAVDRLIDLGGALAEISPDTEEELDAVLPPTWSQAPIRSTSSAMPMPLAMPSRSKRCSPTTRTTPCWCSTCRPRSPRRVMRQNAVLAVAERRADRQRCSRSRCSRCGSAPTRPALRAFEAAGIPHYETEADAVRGFTASRALRGKPATR